MTINSISIIYIYRNYIMHLVKFMIKLTIHVRGESMHL